MSHEVKLKEVAECLALAQLKIIRKENELEGEPSEHDVQRYTNHFHQKLLSLDFLDQEVLVQWHDSGKLSSDIIACFND